MEQTKNRLILNTPVGSLAVLWNMDDKLSAIQWLSNSTFPHPQEIKIPLHLRGFLNQFNCFFESGEPIEALSWDLFDRANWTEFQFRVYEAITKIPHGETRTYAWVAQKAGAPGAPRAVGQALRNNPLPIVIPCHRVVSKNALGGFMGSTDPSQPELRLKHWLIEMENLYRNPVFPFLQHKPQFFFTGAVA